MEMIDLLIFLIKASVIQGVFYVFFHFLFKNRKEHTLNRFYLIGAIVLSLIIPLLKSPMSGYETTFLEPEALDILLAPDVFSELIMTPKPVKDPVFHWGLMIRWIYLIIAAVLLIRSLVHLVILHRLKSKSLNVSNQDFKLFTIAYSHPFSFFSNVFMPEKLIGVKGYEQILMHEYEHVRQRHSIDRLLLDFYVALFWFNPFIYWYRRALIEIHEYQADAGVLKQLQDPLGYQEVLYAQLAPATYSGLVSHFNFSMIKKRIVMMNKTNNNKSKWVYAVALPVTLMLIFAFASKESKNHIEFIEGEISVILAPATPELKVEDTVPSISPIKEEDLKRLSSGYGMRMDPISREKKIHHGVDFSASMGTPVYAAADGLVTEVSTFPSGYGKRIVIEHGARYVTRYAQLSEFKVKEGQKVKKGDVIGLVGSSGRSTAPHLHYEVLKDGEFVDPVDYILDY